MSDQTIQIAAPIDSDSAGRGGAIASQACMRIICAATDSMGTGFLHHSGKIITAEHVVRGCSNPVLMLSDLSQHSARVIAVDPVLDLAILEPTNSLQAPALPISSSTSLSVGAHVSTWGYPAGYSGAAPMLSAGFLGALDAHLIGGRQITRWVVNAAFNGGNSGGPLLLIETGDVIGVVSSKLAPMSQMAQIALTALEGNASGFMYSGVDGQGKPIRMSEGQVIAIVLNELRAQVQLVIGYAVLLADLRSFLTANGITP